MTVQINVPMNAARVCQAISKIGYSPSSAIKDIIDNSVTAKAQNITVELHLAEGKLFSNRNSTSMFRIIDDGTGMTPEEIVNSFQLGSNSSYSEDSLSKYGLGMKSAGLSLGNKICVVSKKNDTLSDCYCLDYDIIKDSGEYVIEQIDLNEDEIDEFNSLVSNESGTIVTITKCEYEKQDSMRKIVNELHSELGVVYYGFLSREDFPLNITIRQVNTTTDDITIEPFDILFTDIAKDEFDPDDYDGLTPCITLNDVIELDGVDSPIDVKAVIFPKDSMKSYPQFSKEQKEQIRSYKIKRSNMGFYIYRNGRLIRWGDLLATDKGGSILTKDDYGVRVSLDLRTVHDEALHVDVSKQKISIPEELEKALRIMLRETISQSKEAFSQCSEMLTFEEDEREDGASFSLQTQDLGEEDTDVQFVPVDQETYERRQDKLIKKTQEEKGDDEESEVIVDDEKVFNKVRYTNSVRGNKLFSIGYNPTEGTFIRVNKNHYFHFTILSRLTPNSPVKQILEAMMFCSGVAERFTYTNVKGIDDEMIEQVLNKLAELYATHLDKWCQLNQNILDNYED